MTIPGEPTSNQMAEDRTEMAARRTLAAGDRTLMAWIRTALSMFSFGITIYKVLDSLRESGHLPHAEGPRTIGLVLIGLGTVSMILGVIQYWGTFKEVRQFKQFRVWRPSFVIALVMSAGGLLMFVAILARAL